MESRDYTLLGNFLEEFIRQSGLNQKKFADSLSQIDPTDSLDASVLNRLITKTGTAREDTLRKIAKIVLGSANASVDQLWERVLAEPEDPNVLRVGTGFTCWSSFILSLISEPDGFPEDVQFVFCNEKMETGEPKPYFVQNSSDIKEMRSAANSERFQYKYVAGDLEKLLNERKIDCAFLLRMTFEDMKFPNLNPPPIQHCRVAVGSGTHMYVIHRADLYGNGTDRAYDRTMNRLMPTDSLEQIIAARQEFCELIQDKRVKTALIGNSTVQRQYLALLKEEPVKKAMTMPKGEDKIDMNTADFEEYIEQIAQAMIPAPAEEESDLIIDSDDRIDVFIVVAFEPLNSIAYQKLLAISGDSTLVYANFNLALMARMQSSYCLYSRVDVIQNPVKLEKANQLLNALNTYVKSMNADDLITKVQNSLVDLYYPNTKKGDPISKTMLMSNALKEMQFNLHSLPFVNLVTRIITESVKKPERRQSPITT